MKRILLSQLLALIAVSFDTKKITLYPNSVIWAEKPEDAIDHSLTLYWRRGNTTGQEQMTAYLTCDEYHPENYSGRHYFRMYLFQGDNCHDSTRFLYSLMAEDTPIIDDIGIVGAGDDITSRTNLLKLNPHSFEVKRKLYDLWEEWDGAN